MAFDQRFLDELTARCDILEIVSRSVVLKKNGTSYFGLCPFHNEKTPSFSVVPDKQMFYCFGCGAGGGAINFIMREEGLSYPDAVHFAAKMYHMTVPEDEKQTDHGLQRKRMLELYKVAARHFYDNLQNPKNEEIYNYFKNRGLKKKTMDTFGLGYAENEWSHLLSAMERKGYNKQELLDAGLAVRSKTGNIYDRFRARVMFPIIDVRGDVIAFGGRVLDDSLPKYLNSPETLIFNKRQNLFGMNIARKSKSDALILAEGYMDVIALCQAGFDGAIASLGTSLTEEQARMIARQKNKVVIAYDADGAGQQATQRAIEIFKKTNVLVKVLRIPDAKDPDEYIKLHGAQAFENLMDEAENHVDYRLMNLSKNYDFAIPEQKVLFLKAAAQLVAGLQSHVEREVYAARAAEMASVSRDGMISEVKKAVKTQARKDKTKVHRSIVSPTAAAQPKERDHLYEDIKSARAEEGILSLLFIENGLFEYLNETLEEKHFSSKILGKIYTLAKDIYKEGRLVSIATMENILTQSELMHLSYILAKPVVMIKREKALEDYIKIIFMHSMQRETGDLIELSRLQREKKGYGGEER